MPSSRSRPKSPEPKGNTIRGNVIFPESACTAEGHYLYPPPVLKVVIPSGLFDPSMYKLEAWATLVCPVDEHRNLDYVLDGVVDCGPEDVRRAPAVTIPNEEGIFFPFVSLSMNQQCFYSVRISVHLVERLDGSCKATLGSYRTGVITVLDGKGAAPQVEFCKYFYGQVPR